MKRLTALCLAMLGTAMAGAACAAPVADALQRPALMVRDPARAVLLNAAWAGKRAVAVGERGIIALSDDHGMHWRQVPVPVSVTLTAVRFTDAQHGVATGHGGTVLTSRDGGESWVLRLDGKQAAALALEAANEANAAANAAGQVRAAEQLKSDGADKPFFDMVLFDQQHMLVVGAYGLAFYTEDGGAHWRSWMGRLDNPQGLHLYTARRHGESLLIAGEQGLVLQSQDGGKSFKRVNVPYKGSFFVAEMPAPDEITVAGLRGNAWRSVDAGATWTQLRSPVPASIISSATAPDGAVLLANQTGLVMRAVRGELVPINRVPVAMPSGLLPGPGGGLLLVGLEGARFMRAPTLTPAPAR